MALEIWLPGLFLLGLISMGACFLFMVGCDQSDRIAAKWADDTKHDAGDVRKDIKQILQNNVSAPFGGLAGEKLVNVLEVNMELCKRYGLPK